MVKASVVEVAQVASLFWTWAALPQAPAVSPQGLRVKVVFWQVTDPRFQVTVPPPTVPPALVPTTVRPAGTASAMEVVVEEPPGLS